jgi:hypothetical protein
MYISISFYIISLIVLGILVFLAYYKQHDKSFLIGILISSVVFLYLTLIFIYDIIIYFNFGFALIGFTCGIIAGLPIQNPVRSILSGVAGIFLGILINPYFAGFSFLFIFISFPEGYFLILSILFGGLGGLIGNHINGRLKLAKNQEMLSKNIY